MTVVNVNLRGKLEKFIEDYISEGYAMTKAEVIRIALINLMKEKEYDDEFEMVGDIMSKEVKKGKIKTSKFSLSELD